MLYGALVSFTQKSTLLLLSHMSPPALAHAANSAKDRGKGVPASALPGSRARKPGGAAGEGSTAPRSGWRESGGGRRNTWKDDIVILYIVS